MSMHLTLTKKNNSKNNSVKSQVGKIGQYKCYKTYLDWILHE